MNKKLSRTIFLLIFTLFLVPQVTFAAWWNPLTWRVFDFFRKSEVKIEQPLDIPTTVPNITVTNNSVNKTEEVKTPKVVEKKKDVVPTTISVPQNTQTNLSSVIVSTPTPEQPTTTPTKNEIDELKEMIDNLNKKVDNLEQNNTEVREQVNKLVKFKPEVTLDKKVIDNNGIDRVQVKIKTVNDDGSIVPNKNIEIITSTGSDGGHKETKTETVTSDSNGNATYNTPTTTAYDRCGVFMSITVKIDNDFVFGQTVSIHNTKPVQSGGGFAACA